MRVEVFVQREDIKRGRQADCRRCPVAIAVRRALGPKVLRGRRVEVRYDQLTVGQWPSLTELVLDKENYALVEQFLFDFDTGRPVKPFSFFVEV